MSGRTVLELPVPPSVNHAYFVARGRKVLSSEGRKYKERVRMICLAQRITPFRGPVRFTLIWRRARRSGDLTNRVKLLEDAVKTCAWIDDSQVVETHCYRLDDRDNPGVTLIVEEVNLVEHITRASLASLRAT